MNSNAEIQSTSPDIIIPPQKTFPKRMQIIADAIVQEWHDKDIQKLREFQKKALQAFIRYCSTQNDSPYKDQSPADLEEGITIFRKALEAMTKQS